MYVISKCHPKKKKKHMLNGTTNRIRVKCVFIMEGLKFGCLLESHSMKTMLTMSLPT